LATVATVATVAMRVIAGAENREIKPKQINLGSTGISGSLVWSRSLPGFQMADVVGIYAGLVFCRIYNLLHRRWGAK
tara:strand:+ start:846 stop:1076 length:231 start_codon:yes stop_codon:yes gene_type:complete